MQIRDELIDVKTSIRVNNTTHELFLDPLHPGVRHVSVKALLALSNAFNSLSHQYSAKESSG